MFFKNPINASIELILQACLLIGVNLPLEAIAELTKCSTAFSCVDSFNNGNITENKAIDEFTTATGLGACNSI
jgi:hypothetical protein